MTEAAARAAALRVVAAGRGGPAAGREGGVAEAAVRRRGERDVCCLAPNDTSVDYTKVW